LKKYSLILLLSIYLIILFISGCIPSKPTEEVEILPAERLVNKLEANRRRIKSFEGTGTLVVQSSNAENKASFETSLIKPDSLYLTILGAFGIQLAQTLVTTDNFIFYDDLHNTAYQGQLSEDVLKNIFKIDLPFSDIIDAFVGSVNLTKHLYKQPTKYSVEYDKYTLTYVDSTTNFTSIYKIDIRSLGITSFQVIDPNGDIALDCKYSDFDYIENVAVPYTIDVQNVKEGQSVSIKYKKIRANAADISIDFKVPDDATIIKW
jgi:outer membrane lipoprotein-sorting protein